MEIKHELVPLAYDIAVKVKNNEINLREGKQIIVKGNRMNSNSAADYINNFKCLIEGRKFTRTLNFYSMDYFLNQIYIDYGKSVLSNSVSALKKHIEYYENKQKSTMHKMRSLVNKYQKLEISNEDYVLQECIIDNLSKVVTKRENLISDLLNYKPQINTLTKFNNHQIRVRDNTIISKLKIIRDFQCQICKTKISTKSNQFYIEAAHIKPKRDFGSEAPSNILILCPNHHKEFDWGDVNIISHSANEVVFIMNKKKYELSLAIV